MLIDKFSKITIPKRVAIGLASALVLSGGMVGAGQQTAFADQMQPQHIPSLGPYKSEPQCLDDQHKFKRQGYTISRHCYASHWGWFFEVK